MRQPGFADLFRTIFAAIFVVIFFVVFTLVIFPICFLVYCINHLAGEKLGMFVCRNSIRVFNFITQFKVEAIGTENIPSVPVYYASNHRSLFDVLAIIPSIKGRLAFISKKEHKKAFFMACWFWIIGTVFIDRSNPREGLKAINKTAEAIKNGRSMVVFPEGTRGHGPSCLPFKAGCFKAAEKANCPIVPITVVDCDAAFEKNHPRMVVSYDIKIIFGKPVRIDGLDKEQRSEVYKAIEEEINETYKKYSFVYNN